MNTDKLINKIVNESEAVKPLQKPKTSVLRWFVLCGAYLALMVYVLGLRTDISDKIIEISFIAEIVIASVAAVMAALAACFLATPDVYQMPKIKLLALLPMAALLGLLSLMAQVQSSSLDVINSTTSTYLCALDIVAFAVFPVVVMLFSLRRARTTQGSWYIAFTALSAANISYIALRIIEPNDVASHLLFWHYLPMLQLSLVGFLFGRALTKW